MTMTEHRIFSSPRAVEEETFRVAVRNSLSKVANAVGLDRFDRDELLDLSSADLITPHWKALTKGDDKGLIPEWAWNQQVKAATRDCVSRWGRL